MTRDRIPGVFLALGILSILVFVATMVTFILTNAPPSTADNTGPQNVRMQKFDPDSSYFKECIVFTHDAVHDTSIAAVCK